jgi:hypothetical protein
MNRTPSPRSLNSLRAVGVVFWAGASLAAVRPSDSPDARCAETADPSCAAAAAHAAADCLRAGAREALLRVESTPVAFAGALTAMGYAGEVPPGLEADPAGALRFKAEYWGRRRLALRRRAGADAASRRRIEAVLADVRADRAGLDSGAALLRRKAALMRSLVRA